MKAFSLFDFQKTRKIQTTSSDFYKTRIILSIDDVATKKKQQQPQQKALLV
jgi:hypothetical protein